MYVWLNGVSEVNALGYSVVVFGFKFRGLLFHSHLSTSTNYTASLLFVI